MQYRIFNQESANYEVSTEEEGDLAYVTAAENMTIPGVAQKFDLDAKFVLYNNKPLYTSPELTLTSRRHAPSAPSPPRCAPSASAAASASSPPPTSSCSAPAAAASRSTSRRLH